MKKLLIAFFYMVLINITMIDAVNAEQKEILPDEVLQQEHILIGACNKKYKCGYINLKNKIAIPFEYRFVDHNINKNGYAIVSKPINGNYHDILGDDYYGIIDKQGNTIVECNEYDLIYDFHDGRAEVTKDKKRGYLDENGKIAIPIQYKKASKFSEGTAVVSLNGKKYGTIDVNGNTLIPFKYDIVGYSKNGLHSVSLNKKWAIFNNKGKQLTPFIFNQEKRLPNNYTAVLIDNKFGIIDEKGNYILKPEYENIDWWSFKDYIEICKANNNGQKNCGMIDSNGKELIPLKYKRVFHLGDNLFKVKNHDDKISYILPKGELEFIKDNAEYEDFIKYKDGYLTAVKKENGNKGILDKNGNVIVPFMYDKIYDFHDGIVRVEKEHRPAYYNKKGENIVPLGKYMFGEDFYDGVAKVTKEHIFYLGDGLINTQGKEVVKPIHTELELLEKNIYGAEKLFGGGGVYDKRGKVLIPFRKYSRIELFN